MAVLLFIWIFLIAPWMMEAMATQLRMGGSLSLAPKFVAGAVGAGVVSVLLVALWGAFVIAMFANVMKLSPQVRSRGPSHFPLPTSFFAFLTWPLLDFS